jgi:predicted membrane protein
MAPILSSLASDTGLVLIIALVIIGVYLIDTITPLGEPVWLLYFIPLILSYWSGRYYAIPVVCIVTLLFLVGGFVVSPQGLAINLAIVNRFTFFLVFISVAILLWLRRRGDIGVRNLD